MNLSLRRKKIGKKKKELDSTRQTNVPDHEIRITS
jgi:hypothetical protein